MAREETETRVRTGYGEYDVTKQVVEKSGNTTTVTTTKTHESDGILCVKETPISHTVVTTTKK